MKGVPGLVELVHCFQSKAEAESRCVWVRIEPARCAPHSAPLLALPYPALLLHQMVAAPRCLRGALTKHVPLTDAALRCCSPCPCLALLLKEIEGATPCLSHASN